MVFIHKSPYTGYNQRCLRKDSWRRGKRYSSCPWQNGISLPRSHAAAELPLRGRASCSSHFASLWKWVQWRSWIPPLPFLNSSWQIRHKLFVSTVDITFLLWKRSRFSKDSASSGMVGMWHSDPATLLRFSSEDTRRARGWERTSFSSRLIRWAWVRLLTCIWLCMASSWDLLGIRGSKTNE